MSGKANSTNTEQAHEPDTVSIVLHVNGAQRTARLDARITLLDALRDSFALTGTKKGCDQGTCGACTVVVDGQRVLSCLTRVPRELAKLLD